MNRLFFPSIACVAVLGWGCSGQRPVQNTAEGRIVALLPMANHSVDVSAPEKVRAILAEELRGRDCRVADAPGVDAAIKELGITDGGQLAALPFEALTGRIEADLYCYGTVLEYGLKSAVALTQRKVELGLKCLDKAGSAAFDRTAVGITSTAGLDAAGEVALNVAGKIVKSVKDGGKKLLPGEKAKSAADATDAVADVDLVRETREAARKLLDKFPK